MESIHHKLWCSACLQLNVHCRIVIEQLDNIFMSILTLSSLHYDPLHSIQCLSLRDSETIEQCLCVHHSKHHKCSAVCTQYLPSWTLNHWPLWPQWPRRLSKAVLKTVRAENSIRKSLITIMNQIWKFRQNVSLSFDELILQNWFQKRSKNTSFCHKILQIEGYICTAYASWKHLHVGTPSTQKTKKI